MEVNRGKQRQREGSRVPESVVRDKPPDLSHRPEDPTEISREDDLRVDIGLVSFIECVSDESPHRGEQNP